MVINRTKLKVQELNQTQKKYFYKNSKNSSESFYMEHNANKNP